MIVISVRKLMKPKPGDWIEKFSFKARPTERFHFLVIRSGGLAEKSVCEVY